MCGKRTRAQPALLLAAVDLRHDSHALAGMDGSDTHGPVSLVGGQGRQIDEPVAELQGHLAGALGCIHMEQHTALPAPLADGGDVLDDSRFVIDVHDGDQHRVVANAFLNCIRIDDAIRAMVHICDLATLVLQRGSRVQHRLVFQARCDQVPAAVPVGVHGADECQVVRLSGPGRKPQCFRRDADSSCDLRPSFLHAGPGAAAGRVR